jgi:hypothetical protein
MLTLQQKWARISSNDMHGSLHELDDNEQHIQTRKKHDRWNERGMEMLIRNEIEHQERLEAAGYRSSTWRVLRALQFLLSATQLQGE